MLLELVGVGGMGRVYRAEQKALSRTVAVKIIHSYLHGESGAAARFITEARAASRLNHPNVVSVIDFGRTEPAEGNLLYLVMEFLRGRDLARLVDEEGPLSFLRIIDILKQILKALDEAHHIGIIHRDIKPENIVIEPIRAGGDLVKVVDFGLAKLRPDVLMGFSSGSTNVTHPGIVCGTPDYMSPEQARGDTLDARSDLYALGVIMFQLLTGRLPFEATTPTQVVLMHLQEAPADPRQLAPERRIPPVLAEIVLRALEKDRERRYVDAAAFLIALEQAQRSLRTSGAMPRSTQASRCPSCSSEVRSDQKFCAECGARLATPLSVFSPDRTVALNSPTSVASPLSMRKATSVTQTMLTSAPQTILPLAFLDREEDLAWLHQRRAEALKTTRAVRLVGEIGIGKTRLVQEFLMQSTHRGDRVVSMNSDPSWSRIGYYALSDAVKKLMNFDSATDILRISNQETRNEEVQRGLHEILHKPVHSRVSPEAQRYAIVTALRWVLERTSAQLSGSLIVLAIDDFERLDGASQHAINDLLGEPPNCPLLILTTHSPGLEANGPIDRTLTRILKGILSNSAIQILRHLSLSTRGNLLEHVGQMQNGVNPLYISQLVHLSQEGNSSVSMSLADLITLRIEHLGANSRLVLQVIALLGDDVTQQEITSLVTTSIALEDAIRPCVQANILEQNSIGFRFVHPLFREIVLASIPTEARRELHANILETTTPRLTPIETRAMHAFYAQDALEALLLLEQVAERCLQRSDSKGAIEALQRGLQLARRALSRGDVDEPERAVIIFSRKLADALIHSGDLTDAEGILHEALNLAGPADSDRARVLESLARLARTRGRQNEAMSLLYDAIETAGRASAFELQSSLQHLETDWRMTAYAKAV